MNLLLPNFWLISIFLLTLSCTDPEIIEVEIIEGVEINVTKNDSNDFGGSGFVNEVHTEFQGSIYCVCGGQNGDKIDLQIANYEWFSNIVWAKRDIIAILNIDTEFALNDTILLENTLGDIDSRIFKVYGHGDQLGECFDLNNLNELKSWLIITEFNETQGVLAGNLNADYVLANTCTELQDETMPDTIAIRDLRFRSELFE